MRRNGTRRHIKFIGLTNTLLTEADVLYLVGILELLPSAHSQMPGASSPKLEIQQTSMSDAVRERIMAAGTRAGIYVRLSP